MKKALSMFLLLIFLFNIVGYKMICFFLEQQVSKNIERRMDLMKDADAGETLTVKIPINLPYQTDWKDFERVDGEITYKGVTYKYFKRKIYNDSITIVCLVFKEKNRIRQAGNDYFKKVNDMAGETNKKQNLKQVKLPDYCQMFKTPAIGLFAVYNKSHLTKQTFLYPPGYKKTMFTPPKNQFLQA